MPCNNSLTGEESIHVSYMSDEDEFIIEARTKTIKEKGKDVRLIYDGKTYVTEEYWHGVPFRSAEKLPYVIMANVCMHYL